VLPGGGPEAAHAANLPEKKYGKNQYRTKYDNNKWDAFPTWPPLSHTPTHSGTSRMHRFL
jgi:hypothetical protein